MTLSPGSGSGGTRRRPRTPSAIAVSDVVRLAILGGDLTPGAHLNEMELAHALGVSRGPVREAMVRLVDEGLLVKLPFKGTFVAPDDPRTVCEISGVRGLVEPFVMIVARANSGPDDLDRLARLHRTLETAIRHRDDVVDVAGHHLAYHRAFYELSHHKVLVGLWNQWEPRLRLALSRDHADVGRSTDPAYSHTSLHDAFIGGSRSAIECEVAHHLESCCAS